MHPLINRLAGDVFVMEPGALEAFLTSAAAISPEMIARLEFDDSGEGDDAAPGYCLSADGTATIEVRGVLLRGGAGMYRAYGIEATGYDEVFGAVTAANADHKVKRIQVVVDSPGGQAAGVHAAADVLKTSIKPLTAHVETLAASGGYWLASQARQITAGRGAQIGSIGAYTVALDLSKRAEQAGIKVHVISSGAYKGAGVPGAALTEDHLKEMQARINKLADEFVADVARGRGVDATQIRASADGRVYSTDEAIARGLVDRITSDPEKDRRMTDALKAAAVLMKEYPGYAADVMDAVANGEAVPALRAKIEKAEADKAAAKREAELVKVKADLETAIAALEAEKVKVAAAETKLADADKSLAALKALAEGAEKAGNRVAADPAKVLADVKCTKAEYAKKTPAELAQFHQAGGVVAD